MLLLRLVELCSWATQVVRPISTPKPPDTSVGYREPTFLGALLLQWVTT